MHRFSSRALASVIAMAAMTAFSLGSYLLVGPGQAASLSSANHEAIVLRVAPANDGPSNTQRSTQSIRAMRIVYPLPNS
jgi:cytochrome c-type biogenesis protein CcmH/NrfG